MTQTEATYTIKAGTVVKINGIPVEVLVDTPAYTHPGNIPLIEEEITVQATLGRPNNGDGE
jgi:hypothetical protein